MGIHLSDSDQAHRVFRGAAHWNCTECGKRLRTIEVFLHRSLCHLCEPVEDDPKVDAEAKRLFQIYLADSPPIPLLRGAIPPIDLGPVEINGW